MRITGNLRKMAVSLAKPVEYSLRLNEQNYPLNSYIGEIIKFSFTGNINCVHCNRDIKKTFNQGYCFPCLRSLAQCDSCIIKPENCHYHLGTCREPVWADNHCMQPHIVYLSNSSGLKVGITRETQIPTRWIDQGAIQALPIAKVSNRYLSGLFEVICKPYVKDKTNWRKMLTNQVESIDLCVERDNLLNKISDKIDLLRADFAEKNIEIIKDKTITNINYPVSQYPIKISSINLDKTPSFEGILHGIKGQYLLTSAGVINLRKYGGYQIIIEL